MPAVAGPVCGQFEPGGTLEEGATTGTAGGASLKGRDAASGLFPQANRAMAIAMTWTRPVDMRSIVVVPQLGGKGFDEKEETNRRADLWNHGNAVVRSVVNLSRRRSAHA